MKSLVLDTNAFAALFAGQPAVLDALAQAETVYASAVVLGELEAGFRGGSRYAANRALVDRFLAKPTVAILPVTRETSDCFGLIKQALQAKGRPLPSNDIWLAAQCLETGSVLLTFDRHFDAVDGLRLWAGL